VDRVRDSQGSGMQEKQEIEGRQESPSRHVLQGRQTLKDAGQFFKMLSALLKAARSLKLLPNSKRDIFRLLRFQEFTMTQFVKSWQGFCAQRSLWEFKGAGI